MRLENFILSIALFVSLLDAKASFQKDLRGTQRKKHEWLYRNPGIRRDVKYNLLATRKDDNVSGSVILARSPGQCLSCGRRDRKDISSESKSNENKSSGPNTRESKTSGTGASMQGTSTQQEKKISTEADSPKSLKKQHSDKQPITVSAPETRHVLELTMAHLRKQQEEAKRDIDRAKPSWDKGIAHENEIYPNREVAHETYLNWQHISPELYNNPGKVPRIAMGKLGKQIESIGSVDRDLNKRMRQKGLKPLERPWWPPMPQSKDYYAVQRQRGKEARIEAQKLIRSKSVPLPGQKMELSPLPGQRVVKWGEGEIPSGWKFEFLAGQDLSRTHSSPREKYIDNYAKVYWHDYRRRPHFAPFGRFRYYSSSSGSDSSSDSG